MPRPLKTPAERLVPLLDWMNANADHGRGWPAAERHQIEGRLDRFIRSFDGSADSGFIRAEVETPSVDDRPGFIPVPPREGVFDDDELADLLTGLRHLLHRGFRSGPGFVAAFGSDAGWGAEVADVRVLPSLRLGIERVAPFEPRARERRRLVEGPGIYVMRATGDRADLVLFLVMTLLTRPGAILLGRCPVRAPYATEPCGNFFLHPPGPGRPRKNCGNNCAQRRHWESDVSGRKAAKRNRTRRETRARNRT